MNHEGIIDNHEFISICGDASQKQFFKVFKDGRLTPFLLLKFPETSPRSDESFIVDDNPADIRQDDYYATAAQFLYEKGLKMTPKYYERDRENHIILIENVGQISLNDIRLSDPDRADKIYLQAIDWLHQLQSLTHKTDEDKPCDSSPELTCDLKKRIFEEKAMMCELDEFLQWVVINQKQDSDETVLSKLKSCFTKLVQSINSQPKSFVHRDFQSRNIMVRDSLNESNDSAYIIDVQDLCIGPRLYDIASLIYDANASLSHELITRYAMAYLGDTQDRTIYLKQLRETGLQRVLKNMGRHSKYSIRDGRDTSTKYLVKNREVYQLLKTSMSIDDDYKELFFLLDEFIFAK